MTTAHTGVSRRTFEALNHPKFSPERGILNLNAVTSEYGPSHKYAAQGEHYSLTFRTKREAIAFHSN